MKARVHHFSEPRRRNSGYDCEELKIEIDLPFVPTQGTGLQVTPNGEILIVDQVMWLIEEPDVLLVFTKEPEISFRPYKEMIAEGWVGD
ncbi:hypothetical protein [Herbaspirillum sp. ST 5-3]|uniref:hypothetical protein n=1 Tax=Oxalobacteraceae TaxID=75682 RepID=UPI0010A44435|nr:hypothetical protein [Herbaspirillum sp. ST 5-3]